MFFGAAQWTESIGLQAAVCTLKEFHNWEHFYKQLSTNAERLREAIIDSFENSHENHHKLCSYYVCLLRFCPHGFVRTIANTFIST